MYTYQVTGFIKKREKKNQRILFLDLIYNNKTIIENQPKPLFPHDHIFSFFEKKEGEKISLKFSFVIQTGKDFQFFHFAKIKIS